MSIAFFDIDGTLMAKPSLERRFFWNLRAQGAIPARNYLAWLAESVRLAPRGIRAAAYANKMYLRGLKPESLFQGAAHSGCSWLPRFIPAAVQRLWWHTSRGDAIVLVSGTLSPLAQIVKHALERALLWRGVEVNVSAITTQLEACNGRWTGRISDLPILAESKARAITEFAKARQISLARCSAYGDSSLDRWMLASVGYPFATNPTLRLRRVARLHGWPMLRWASSPLRAAEQRDSTIHFDEIHLDEKVEPSILQREGQAAV
jgi:phosphoserine phosphatase